MELSDLMEQAASERTTRAPSNDQLSTVSELANRQVSLESLYDDATVISLMNLSPSVPELEEALKRQKEELSKIKEYELPKMLEAIGLTEFKLTNGGTVSIKEEVYAGITDENKPKAFAWLAETGNDGLIKNEVKVPFGKGQEQEASQFVDELLAKGISFSNNKSVHPQTLKAFVKRQMEDGVVVPPDIFSIHLKSIATVKFPKEKK